ncbi:MAG: CHASE2 domain-containing protein [Planctomycetes bacterium]|nr:CHASE2 domain-containing protein [Planctomycetota bacterium]
MTEPSSPPTAPPPAGGAAPVPPPGVRPAAHEEPKRLSFGAAEAAAKARADAAAEKKSVWKVWWEDPNVRHRVIAMSIGLSFTLLIIAFAALPFTEPMYTRLEFFALDQRHKLCPKTRDSGLVAHIDIDDPTNNTLQTFPFPRKNHAYTILALRELGARLILFDVEFKNIGTRSIVEWHDEISIAADPAVEEEIVAAPPPGADGGDEEAPAPPRPRVRLVEDDLLLQIAINDAGNVYIPFDLRHDDKLQDMVRENRKPLRAALLADFTLEESEFRKRHPELGAELLKAMEGNLNKVKELVLADFLKEEFLKNPNLDLAKDVRPRVLPDFNPLLHEGYANIIEKAFTNAQASTLLEKRFALGPAPERLGATRSSLSMLPLISRFGRNVHGSGFSNILQDLDGSSRRMPLYWEIDGFLMPHLQLRAAAEVLGIDPRADIVVEPGEYVELRNVRHPMNPDLKTIHIPVDEKGQVIIAWAQGNDPNLKLWPFPHVSFIALVNYWRIRIELERAYIDFERQARPEPRLLTLRQKWERLAADTPEKQDDLRAVKKEMKEIRQSLFRDIEEVLKTCEGEIRKKITGKVDATRTAVENPRTPPSRLKLYQDALAKLQAHLDRFEAGVKAGALSAETQKLLQEEKNFDTVQEGVDQFDSYVDNYAKALIFRDQFKGKEQELKTLGDELAKGIRDRVCLIGSASTASGDLLATPLWPNYPGVGLHANLLNDMFSNRFIYRVDKKWSLLAILISGLVVSLIVTWMGPIPAGAFTVGYSMLTAALAIGLFVAGGAWIDFMGPLLGMFLPYSSITAYRQLTEETKKRQVKKMFEHYLAPEVVNEMMKNPEGVQLGGTRMMATVFFSDIAGFTTMSERMEPEDVVSYLNEYFNAAAPILMKYGGYMDKFIGDAIMCIFGVPLPRDDHAIAAVMASIEVQEALTALNDKFMSEKKPALRVRIGLASGPMVVGNIGSEQKVNYTVIGDIVNLGSRLEGQNKEYKTRILAHFETYEACQDKIVGRELDLIAVKGKKQAVKVYEPIQIKGRPLPIPQEALDLFAQGLALYRQRKFQEAIDVFNRVLDIHTADGPTLTYLSRCEYYLEDPPPEDWDGSFHAKSK